MQKLIGLMSLMFLIVGCGPTPKTQPKEDWGKFSGQPKTVWLDDGREMKLLDDFVYTDNAGKAWLAKKETLIDGASIPRFMWTIIGGPFEGPYRNASIVHDSYYVDYRENSDVVHKMFYEAMRCGGVPERKAKVMFWAVYKFGGSWVMENGKPKFLTKAKPPTEEEVLDMKQFIETNNPSIEYIQKMK